MVDCLAAGKAVVAAPVLVAHVAVAQVGNAGAAQHAQAREGLGVRLTLEQHVDPVPAALQRRAVVGRAQEHQCAEPPHPIGALLRAVVHRAARHQSPHAVTDDDQRLHRHRPGRHQRGQLPGQRPAVGRHVQTRVVVQVDGREAEVARQCGAMVVRDAVGTGPLPLQVVHAQAMHQQQQPSARLRHRAREGHGVEVERLPVAAQRHPDRQRVGGARQVVAQHAVERRQKRGAGSRVHRRGRVGGIRLGRSGGIGCAVHKQRLQRAQQCIQAAAHGARDAAHAAVDQARHAVDGGGRRRTCRPRGRVRHAQVQRLHQFGHADGGVDGHFAHATQRGDMAGGGTIIRFEHAAECRPIVQPQQGRAAGPDRRARKTMRTLPSARWEKSPESA